MAYRRTAAAAERDERSRAVILGAARDVVRESGLTGAAITAVAAKAGVAVGTVYRHFPSRDDLIAEVVRETCGRELTAVAAVATSERPPIDRLVEAVELFATRALASGRLAYSMIAEPTSEAAEALRLVIRAELAALFTSIVADGVATGAFERQDPGDERHGPRRRRFRNADRPARPSATDWPRPNAAALLEQLTAVHVAFGRRPVVGRAGGRTVTRPMTGTEPTATDHQRAAKSTTSFSPDVSNGLGVHRSGGVRGRAGADLHRRLGVRRARVGGTSGRRLRHAPARARPGDHGPRPRWRRARDGQPVQPPRRHALPARVGQRRVVRVHLPRLDVRPRRRAARRAAAGRHVQRPRRRSG